MPLGKEQEQERRRQRNDGHPGRLVDGLQDRAQIGATTYLLPSTQGLTAGATEAGPGTGKGTTPAAPAASATPAASPSTPTAAIGATP